MSKTLVQGTSYDVSGGTLNIQGTAYTINHGKTRIGGVGYGIYLGSARKVFYWGSNNEMVYGNWLQGLQDTLQNSSPEEIKEAIPIGATKYLYIPGLGNAIGIDTVGHYGGKDYQLNPNLQNIIRIRVIGVNEDGDNTVTFLSEYCVRAHPSFGGYCQWKNSNFRDLCQAMYDVFPAQDAIKTLRKGTNLLSSRASLAYTEDNIWIPSIWELGEKVKITAGNIIHGTPAYDTLMNLTPEYTEGNNKPYSYFDRSWDELGQLRVKSVGEWDSYLSDPASEAHGDEGTVIAVGYSNWMTRTRCYGKNTGIFYVSGGMMQPHWGQIYDLKYSEESGNGSVIGIADVNEFGDGTVYFCPAFTIG